MMKFLSFLSKFMGFIQRYRFLRYLFLHLSSTVNTPCLIPQTYSDRNIRIGIIKEQLFIWKPFNNLHNILRSKYDLGHIENIMLRYKKHSH